MKLGFGTVLPVLAAMAATPAAAQTAAAAQDAVKAAPEANTGVAEVVVTAQKRVERLQDVPVAVSSVSAQQFKAVNLTNVTDIRFLTPSVQFAESNSVRGEGFSIRGIGTFAFADGTEQSVSVLVDGVVLGRPGMGTSDLLDIAQVDVLRGPQGMLFGKGGSAGVISITTNNPTQTPQMDGRLSYGTDNEVKAEAIANIPLTDTLAWRTSAYYNRRDGFIDDVYNGKTLGGMGEAGLRSKLLWKPDADTSILIDADWAHHTSACCQSTIVGTVGAPANNYVVSRLKAYDITPSLNNTETDVGGDVYMDETQGGVAATVNRQFAQGYTLTSISAFRDWTDRDNTDTGFTDTPVFPVNGAHEYQRQYTEELRVASPKGQFIDYVAGLYYFNQDVKAAYPQQGELAYPASTTVYSRDAHADILTINYAAFGQANINVTNKWKLIAGGRYTHDDLTLETYNRTLVSPTDAGFPGAPPLSFNDSTYPSYTSANNVSYRFGSEYRFTPDLMAYVTYARGYKGPGLGLISGYTLDQPLFSRPEIPVDIEGGFKTSWFSHKLVFNIDAFDTNIHDFQVEVDTPFIFNGASLATLQVANAKEANTHGVEMDFTARPIRQLTLYGNGAYVDATFTNFPNGTCNYAAQPGCFSSTVIPGTTTVVPATTFFNDTGKVLPNAPKFTVSVGANYDVPVTDRLTGFIRGNYNYRSSVNFSPNGDPLTAQRGYGIAGGQLGVRSEDGRWDLAVFARNLFDTHFVTAINNNGLYQNAWLTSDAYRTVGVVLDAKFNP